jgi:PAS domain S-box-containing protein
MRPEHKPDFEILANTVAAAIFIVKDERFTYLNNATEAITGYTREELLNMRFWDIVHPDQREAVKQRGLGRQRGGQEPSRYEFKIITKSGVERWGEFSGTAIELGDESAVLGTAFDITDRKKAREALEESEQRYRTLFDENVDGVAVVVDGKIVHHNARFAEMMGRADEDICGRSPAEFPVPEERSQVGERVRAVLEGGTEFPSVYHVQRPDASVLPVEVISRLIQYEGRSAIMSVVRDISARVEAEQAVLKARDELEGKVERQLLRRNPYGLSFRELTVLHLVAAGHADKEIAAELGISPLTAQKHVSNILGKMNASSRTEAGVRAVREALLNEEASISR